MDSQHKALKFSVSLKKFAVNLKRVLEIHLKHEMKVGI